MVRSPRHLAPSLLASSLLLASASCDYQIFGVPQQATSLSITGGNVVLLPGTSSRFSVSGTGPNGLAAEPGKVTWSSSFPHIASVSSNGLVTGHQLGNASIRARNSRTSTSAPVKVRSAFCTAATVVGTIPLSTPTAGTLTLDECVWGGRIADAYALSVGGPTTLAITVTASPFTPAPFVTDLLLVDNPNGEFGIGAPLLGGRFVHELAAGSHRIWMTSTGTLELGSYTITATSVTRCTPAQAGGGFVLGATRIGALDDADCYFDDGSQADGQALTLVDSAFLAVTTTSTAYVPIAFVTRPAMSWFNSAFESRPDDSTRVQIFQLGPGTYALWSSPAVDDFGTGAFTQSTGTVPYCTPGGTTRPITIGATVVDSLTLADCMYPGPSPPLADGWRLTVADPTNLQVDITNTFGTSFAGLFLTTEAGTPLNVTHISISLTKSRIEHQLSPGTYLLYARSSGGSSVGAGAFTVEVRAIP